MSLADLLKLPPPDGPVPAPHPPPVPQYRRPATPAAIAARYPAPADGPLPADAGDPTRSLAWASALAINAWLADTPGDTWRYEFDGEAALVILTGEGSVEVQHFPPGRRGDPLPAPDGVLGTSGNVTMAEDLVGTAGGAMLTGNFNVITSCPPGASFKLNAAYANQVVQNNDANNYAPIYPPPGESINGQPADQPYYVNMGGGRVTFTQGASGIYAG